MKTQELAQQLNDGKIGVLPTDTIYGIVARALDAAAVERVYEVRKRRPDKPCIILIADVSDLERFSVAAPVVLEKVWPGSVSVVLPCDHTEYAYLHRGTKTLAFRLPADEQLCQLLRLTGPLIAPSANPEGMKPAASIDQAKAYFDDAVDFYSDGGLRVSQPSTVVEVRDGKLRVLREGSVSIPKDVL